MMTYKIAPRQMAVRRAVPTQRYADVHIPVDVIGDEDAFTVTAFMPGVRPEDVKIEILKNVLTIEGELLETELAEGERVLLQERPSGTFRRTLRLPAEVDADKVDAEVKNGVLSMRIPKAETAKAHQIKVKTK